MLFYAMQQLANSDCLAQVCREFYGFLVHLKKRSGVYDDVDLYGDFLLIVNVKV